MTLPHFFHFFFFLPDHFQEEVLPRRSDPHDRGHGRGKGNSNCRRKRILSHSKSDAESMNSNFALHFATVVLDPRQLLEDKGESINPLT